VTDPRQTDAQLAAIAERANGKVALAVWATMLSWLIVIVVPSSINIAWQAERLAEAERAKLFQRERADRATLESRQPGDHVDQGGNAARHGAGDESKSRMTYAVGLQDICRYSEP